MEAIVVCWCCPEVIQGEVVKAAWVWVGMWESL